LLEAIAGRLPTTLPPAQQDDLFEHAIVIARGFRDDNLLMRSRYDALISLAASLRAVGAFDRERALVHEALGVAPDERSDRFRRAFGRSHVRAHLQIDDPDSALDLANGIEDVEERRRALLDCASALLAAGRPERAREAFRRAAAGSARNEAPEARAEAFEAVARVLLELGDARSAVELARTIEQGKVQSRLLAKIGESLSASGDFQQCRAVIEGIHDAQLRSDAFRAVGLKLIEAGSPRDALSLLADARAALGRIEHDASRSAATANVAKGMIRAGYPAEALRCFVADDPLLAINNSTDRGQALLEIARALVHAERADDAAALLSRALAAPAASASQIDTLDSLASTTKALARVNRLPQRDDLFDKAVAVCRPIRDPSLRCDALVLVADAMTATALHGPALELLEEAVQVVSSMRAPAQQAWAMAAILESLLRAGQFDQARDLAEGAFAAAARIRDCSLRCDCLVRLADACAGDRMSALRGSLLSAAYAGSIRAADPGVVCTTLVRLADAWVRTGSPANALANLRQSRALARRIRDAALRSQVLVDIADAFVRAGDAASAKRALDVALKSERRVSDPSLRTGGLVEITDALFRAGVEHKAVQVFEEAAGPADEPRDIGTWSQYVTRSAVAGGPYGYGWTSDGFGRPLDYRARWSPDAPATDYDGSRAIEAIVKELLGSRDYDAATTGTLAIANNGVRLSSRLDIVDALVKEGNAERARRLLADTVNDASGIESADALDRARGRMAGIWTKLGDHDTALSVALAINDPGSRCDALLSIADSAARHGTGGQIEPAVGGALDAARLCSHPGVRAECLAEAAAALTRSNRHELAVAILREALEATHLLRKPSSVRRRIAGGLAEAGDHAGALDTASAITERWERSFALANIAATLIRAGLLSSLPPVTRRIRSDHDRRSVAILLAESGHPARAVTFARRMRTPSERTHALARIAALMAQTSEPERARPVFEKAVASADLIADDYRRAEAVGQLTRALLDAPGFDDRASLFERVLPIARRIGDYRQRESVSQVLSRLGEAGGPDQVMSLIRRQPDDEWKAESLADLGDQLRGAGDSTRALAALEEALAVARSIKSESAAVKALGAIVDVRLGRGEVDQALTAARTVAATDARIDASHRVAAGLLAEGRLGQAVELLQQLDSQAGIADPEKLMTALAKSGISTTAGQAALVEIVVRLLMNAARARGAESLVATCDALAGLSPPDRALVDAELTRGLFEALGLENVSTRNKALLGLAKHLASRRSYEMFHDFAEIAAFEEEAWHELMGEWRKLLITADARGSLPWLRRSLLYHPFSAELAFGGVRALHLARLAAGDREVFIGIIDECPQLGLTVLSGRIDSGSTQQLPNHNPNG
jgi:tetratricopeptide (TPR) repeat protein